MLQTCFENACLKNKSAFQATQRKGRSVMRCHAGNGCHVREIAYRETNKQTKREIIGNKLGRGGGGGGGGVTEKRKKKHRQQANKDEK